MADDIKVKFGGDFSDLSKGAKEAAEAAGVAMTSSFSSFTSKLSSSFIAAIGVGSVATTLFHNIFESFAKFKELDSMSRKLGVSAEDLQKFGRIGKEAGVDMETMGRGIAFANKFIGAAQLGVEGNVKTLEKLGFTQTQINAGNVKAADVIMALAKSYEETKSETIAAAQAQSVFGKTGLEMVGVIKQGTEALKEQLAVEARFTNEEVKRGALMEKRIEKGKKFLDYHLGEKQASTIGYISERIDVVQALRSTGVSPAPFGMGNENEFMRDKEKFNSVVAGILSESKRLGLSLTSVSDILYDYGQDWGMNGKFYTAVSAKIYEEAQRQEKDKPAKVEISEIATEPTKALVTSSLQSIGGGDITSVYAGVDYQKTIADQTTLANQYLQMIATSNGQFAAAIKSTPINAAK